MAAPDDGERAPASGSATPDPAPPVLAALPAGRMVERHCYHRPQRLADDSTERLRVFSWLGMAFSLANVIGPVCAGFMIDAAGIGAPRRWG